MAREPKVEFLKHVPLPTPPVVLDTVLDAEDTAVNKAQYPQRAEINKKNTHVQWFLSTVEKNQRRKSASARLWEGEDLNRTVERPWRYHLNIVMKEVRESAVSMVLNGENNIVRSR